MIIEEYVTKNNNIFLMNKQELCPTSDTNLVKSLMNLMDCQMATFRDEGKFSQLDERQVIAYLEGIFFFSLTWSIGASGTEAGRVKFDMLVKELQEVRGPIIITNSYSSNSSSSRGSSGSLLLVFVN